MHGSRDLGTEPPPSATGGAVALRDGSTIAIRPIEPRDANRLEIGFARLSDETRRRRFLTPIDRLDAETLTYLTDIDHHDHEALVAIAEEEFVGVSRYVRRIDDPGTADIAVVVLDEWQGRGVATELLTRLMERAIEEGVERFGATLLAENQKAADALTNIGAIATGDSSSGLSELEIDLHDRETALTKAREILHSAAARLLSAVQRGRTTP